MARRRAWLLLLSFLHEYYEGGIGSLLLVDCILLKAAYSPLVTSVSSLPHGYLAILAALCATFGTCLSIPALVWCEFVTISDANLVEGIPPISTAARGFGLVGYEKYENSCQPYDEGWDRFPDDLGSQHKAAGAFGILALCLGFVGMVVSWCICCVAFPQRFMKSWGITYSFTALFQILTILFLGSDICNNYDCSIGGSFGLAIAAFVFWVGAAICTLMTPGYKDEEETKPKADTTPKNFSPTVAPSPEGEIQIVVKESIEADGSKSTEKVTTYPGGSRTVETITTVAPPVVSSSPDENQDVPV